MFGNVSLIVAAFLAFLCGHSPLCWHGDGYNCGADLYCQRGEGKNPLILCNIHNVITVPVYLNSILLNLIVICSV